MLVAFAVMGLLVFFRAGRAFTRAGKGRRGRR
jgi:hypothetical protein